jgi:hypothetical protein
MKFKNKKGLTIVVVVLYILLIVAAIAAMAIIFVRLSEKINLSPKLSCATLKFSPTLEIKSACYNETSRNMEMEIFRKFESGELDSMEFVFNINGENSQWKCGNDCNSCSFLERGEIRRYYFDASGFNFNGNLLSVVLKVNGCEIETRSFAKCS